MKKVKAAELKVGDIFIYRNHTYSETVNTYRLRIQETDYITVKCIIGPTIKLPTIDIYTKTRCTYFLSIEEDVLLCEKEL